MWLGAWAGKEELGQQASSSCQGGAGAAHNTRSTLCFALSSAAPQPYISSPAADAPCLHVCLLLLPLQAAPEAVKTDAGELTRRLHCYVVFTDHAGACAAKRVLIEQAAGVGADVLRVRFCKPLHVTALCTPAFRAFVTAQWTQSAAVAKAHPESKKASCKVNALFVSKLHQHITTARLTSLFGKFGPMIACEVRSRPGPRVFGVCSAIRGGCGHQAAAAGVSNILRQR